MGRNPSRKGRILSAALMLGASASLQANSLPVLADNGGTPVQVVMSTLFEQGEEAVAAERPEAITAEPVTKEQVMAKLSFQFPYRSGYARPGKLTNRDFQQPRQEITAPFAFVGLDRRSIGWLSSYKHKLKELGATVVVVAASNPDEINRIKRIYKGQVMPLQADVLLEKYQIAAYPALLTTDGVYQ